MKLLLHVCLLIASASLTAGTQLVNNPGFETPPFPSSCTNSGAITATGLNGTTTAARLSYNTTSAISQTLTATAADFTADSLNHSKTSSPTPKWCAPFANPDRPRADGWIRLRSLNRLIIPRRNRSCHHWQGRRS